MKKQTRNPLERIADRLEKSMGTNSMAAANSPASGLFTNVSVLIAALRSGEPVAIARAFRDILNSFLGDTGESIAFSQEQATAAGVHWPQLVDGLNEVMPHVMRRHAG